MVLVIFVCTGLTWGCCLVISDESGISNLHYDSILQSKQGTVNAVAMAMNFMLLHLFCLFNLFTYSVQWAGPGHWPLDRVRVFIDTNFIV